LRYLFLGNLIKIIAMGLPPSRMAEIWNAHIIILWKAVEKVTWKTKK
jgi:hypothetical protein